MNLQIKDFLLSTVRKELVDLFQIHILGYSCCEFQVATLDNLPEHLHFTGREKVSPYLADVLVVTGIVTEKLGHHLKDYYNRLDLPKFVITVGSCANSGSPFKSYSVVSGTRHFLPIDVYVPGCPPRSSDFFDALEKLKIKTSWST